MNAMNATKATTPMNLWRLEWARLWRTRRWPALGAVFLLAGFGGPLAARYLAALMRYGGSGVVVVVPPPTPADGIAGYVHNAGQLGLVTVVVVAAASLAMDADPGRAAFYRTRVSRPGRLLLPRYTVVAAATLTCFLLGTLAAWYETAVLLGPPPPGRMLAGAALQGLHLLFVTATVALAGSVVRSSLATIGVALSVQILLPAVGSWQPLHPWLPSSLADSLIRIPDHPLVLAAVTAACTAALLGVATHRLARREL